VAKVTAGDVAAQVEGEEGGGDGRQQAVAPSEIEPIGQTPNLSLR
jgi:hypothetical protein